MLFGDLPNALVKLDFEPDRAGVLERAWQRAFSFEPLANETQPPPLHEPARLAPGSAVLGPMKPTTGSAARVSMPARRARRLDICMFMTGPCE